MNPGRFFIPNMMVNPMMRNAYMLPREANIFSKLFTSIKNINFGKILTGTSKTLNVMNQAIPLIRETGSIINNAKSMLHIAKAFKNETTPSRKTNKINHHNNIKNNNINSYNKTNSITANTNSPTFFL